MTDDDDEAFLDAIIATNTVDIQQYSLKEKVKDEEIEKEKEEKTDRAVELYLKRWDLMKSRWERINHNGLKESIRTATR